MLFKKVMALYIRLSIEDGDLKKNTDKTESNSVTNQRKLLMDYIQSHPELSEYELQEYCDDGYTGTNLERPRFQEMMENVKRGQIHCIIVKDLSRFGREYLEVGAYLELILPLFGTRFISVNDAFDSNRYVGTTGGMELALHNLINGMYSRDLSVKVRSAIKTRNRRGQYWGGFAFYGYELSPEDKHKLVVDEEVRHIIVKIFELCIEGFSTMQIAQKLNGMNVPCPAEHKKRKGQKYNGRMIESTCIWIGSTVRKILNDERYTGKMITGTRETDGIRSTKMRSIPKDQWFVVEDAHEAIITQEMFDAAAASLKSRIRTVNENTAGDRKNNLFVCGFCGRKLQKSTGKQIHLYCMKGRNDSSSICGGIHEEWDALQQSVLSVVRSHAGIMLDNADQYVKEHITEETRLGGEIRRMESKLASLRVRKATLYEEYRKGHYSKEQFMRMQHEDQRTIEKLESQIKRDRSRMESMKHEIDRAQKTITRATELLPLHTYDPNVIRKFVSEIRVFGNHRLEISFTHKDMFASGNDAVSLTQ